MNYKSFLIKYAEIGVKGKNRYLFEDALVKQINNRLKRHDGAFVITKEQGRIYAEASEDYDFDEVINALQHVFGIVGICPMVQVEKTDFESLKEEVAKSENKERISEEFGDLLFAMINYARKMEINPSHALEQTNKKFIQRFEYIEQQAESKGISLTDMSLEQMEELWQRAKTEKKS